MVSDSLTRERLLPETTEDLSIVGISEVALSTLPPQAAILWADYRVDLVDADPALVAAAVAQFVEREEFSWSEEKKERTKTYNLRAAVASMAGVAVDGGVRLTMRLQADATLTARPEQVLEAILPGVAMSAITRA